MFSVVKIGKRRCDISRAVDNSRELQAGSPAIQQVGNLRYGGGVKMRSLGDGHGQKCGEASPTGPTPIGLFDQALCLQKSVEIILVVEGGLWDRDLALREAFRKRTYGSNISYRFDAFGLR